MAPGTVVAGAAVGVMLCVGVDIVGEATGVALWVAVVPPEVWLAGGDF